ncbi:hypothetical protein [Aliiroseovarius sp. 2305UL8-7]|uniref:hypothetical protein n=1 Tax=Aliiroseovarius conchicola TaxID=3121637 RepID=UPI0035293B4A
MSDISELETRITTALERISTGLSALAPQSDGAEEELARLKTELEDEKTANSQLDERMAALQQSHSDGLGKMRGDIERAATQLSADEAIIMKLRQANADLRANNDALRQAVSDGVADPDLVNSSLQAELEGLRVAQAADRAELDAVLGELGQLIAENDPGAPKAASSTPTEKEGTDA